MTSKVGHEMQIKSMALTPTASLSKRDWVIKRLRNEQLTFAWKLTNDLLMIYRSTKFYARLHVSVGTRRRVLGVGVGIVQ